MVSILAQTLSSITNFFFGYYIDRIQYKLMAGVFLFFSGILVIMLPFLSVYKVGFCISIRIASTILSFLLMHHI